MFKLDTHGVVSVSLFSLARHYEHISLTHLISSSDAMGLFTVWYFTLVKFLLKNWANSSSSEEKKKCPFQISLGKA